MTMEIFKEIMLVGIPCVAVIVLLLVGMVVGFVIAAVVGR